MTFMDSNLLISASHACDILRISKTTIIKWAKSGKLWSRQLEGLSRTWVFDKSEVEALAIKRAAAKGAQS